MGYLKSYTDGYLIDTVHQSMHDLTDSASRWSLQDDTVSSLEEHLPGDKPGLCGDCTRI